MYNGKTASAIVFTEEPLTFRTSFDFTKTTLRAWLEVQLECLPAGHVTLSRSLTRQTESESQMYNHCDGCQESVSIKEFHCQTCHESCEASCRPPRTLRQFPTSWPSNRRTLAPRQARRGRSSRYRMPATISAGHAFRSSSRQPSVR